MLTMTQRGLMMAAVAPAAPVAFADTRNITASETTISVDVLENDENVEDAVVTIQGSVSGATAQVVGQSIEVTRSGTGSGSYSLTYRATTAAGFAQATLSGSVAAVSSGGEVGPIESVNGSLLQVAISVGTSPRQSWIGYGWGANSHQSAIAAFPAAQTHVNKLCEDINATVIRFHTPESPSVFINAYKRYWDLVKNHGIDTIFSSSYIYRSANGTWPTITAPNPTGAANGINDCIIAGVNPARWAATLQNEPDGGNLPDGSPKNQPYPSINPSGSFIPAVRTDQITFRNRLNTLGRTGVITLGLEWRHPTDSGRVPAEFDGFNANGEVGTSSQNPLQEGCIHIYNKGPNPSIYDQRYLTKGLGLWSGETGDMSSPRAQAIFLAGVNHGVRVEIAHIGISSSGTTSDARQFLLLGNGVLNPWYNGIKIISTILVRNTRMRLCTSSDRPTSPSVLNATNAERMIWTNQIRNPRQFVICGKRPDNKWIICAVSHAYGADSPQPTFAGGHYEAIDQQLTVTIPELAGAPRTWSAQRATSTGSLSSQSYNMDNTGRIRFSLPAGDTVALITNTAA